MEIQSIYNAGTLGKKAPAAPTIVAQPQNQSVATNSSAFFTVVADGSSPFTYQWKKDGVNLPSGDTRIFGVKTAFLNIVQVKATDAGIYTVSISNTLGQVTSSNAILTILTPPVIDVQPQGKTNPPGSTVEFHVAAHGNPAVTYQWKKNGLPLSPSERISGIASDTLTIRDLTTTDAGGYSVNVSNDRGFTSSQEAQLRVYSVGGEDYTSMIGFWHADSDARDSFGSNHGSLQGAATFAPGKVNQGFIFDGTNGAVVIPDATSLKPASLTVEAWVMFNGTNSVNTGGAPAGLQYIVFKQNTASGTNFNGYALTKIRDVAGDRLSFRFAAANGSRTNVDSTAVVTTGQFYHVVGTYDGATACLYVNGVLQGRVATTIALDYNSSPLYFGTTGQSYDGKLRGVLDEVRLYGRALSAAEVYAHYNQGNLGFVGLKLVSTNFVDRASNDRGLGVSVLNQSVYISAGMTINGNADAALIRYNLPLNPTNTPTFATNWPGLQGADRFSSVAALPDGVYFAGDSMNRTVDTFGSKESKGIVVKMGLNGPVATNAGYAGAIWDKQVPAAPGVFAYSGTETIHGMTAASQFLNDRPVVAIYVTGSAQRSSSNPGRLFVSKMSGEGLVSWTTNDLSLSTTTGGNAYSVGRAITLANGNIFVAGGNEDSGSLKATITKFDSAGAFLSSSAVSTGQFNGITSFGGSIYAVGATATNGSDANFLVEKRNENGAVIWSRNFDRFGDEDILNGVVGIGSRIYAVGSTKGDNSGGTDAVLLEIDTVTGDLISTTLYGGSDDEVANAVTTDGSDLYIVGESKSYGGSGNNVMLLRYKVSQAAVALNIITTSLPVASVNSSYSSQLVASGGLPPFTWSLATNSASLPSGLFLLPNGIIYGSASVPGTYQIIVQATDSSTVPATATAQFRISVVSAQTPPSVSILSPANGATYDSPADISFSISASDSDGLGRVELYQNGSLVSTVSNIVSTVSIPVNGLATGSYDFQAVAYDIYDAAATSGTIHVTVNGAGRNAIDFESFAITDGGLAVTNQSSIAAYLGAFGITISDVTANTYLAVNRDSNVSGGRAVAASSGHNYITQSGKNGPVSYTLNFAAAAPSVGFTRLKLLGSSVGITHPRWTATAYNGTNIVSSVGEGPITSYAVVAEQKYVLYGPNITSVKIEADNYNWANFSSALLDDFVIVTNAAVITHTPPTVSITSPSSGTFYTAPAQVTVSASATPGSVDTTITNIKIYLGSSLVGTIAGDSGSITLDNVAPNSAGYALRAVATDSAGATRSTDNVAFFVQTAAGISMVNFDSVDASTRNVGRTDLAAYLSGYGITATNVTGGSRLEIVNGRNLNSGSSISPSSPENILAQSGRTGPVSYTLKFSTPLQSLRFTRAKALAGSYGVTYPQWRARAFNSAGVELTSVGESLFYSATDVAARTFELNASGISSVRFDSDGQARSTFTSVVIDDLVLNVNTVAPAVSVAIRTPVDGDTYTNAPATINISADATAVSGVTIDHVEFYAGPVLIGTDATSSYDLTWSNVYPGTYELKAVAVDNNGGRYVSASVNVTVTAVNLSASSKFINFDSLDASTGNVSGSALVNYLANYGITITSEVSMTNVVQNQRSLATSTGISRVVATSPENIFTQLGNGDRLSMTLQFATPLTQFQFTRPKLLAGYNGLTHPGWQAYALDAGGNTIATVSEDFITSYSDVAAQSFTLAGQGIVRVRFDSFNRHAAAFAAVLLDDLILTERTGNLPPAVNITFPANGATIAANGVDVYNNPNNTAKITVNASALDPDGTVAQVMFYANGNLIATASSSPYTATTTNLPLGSYTLTAVATDNSGATNAATPVVVNVVSLPTVFTITSQPQSQTVARGSNAVFRVAAAGGTTITYRWTLNGTNISGANSSVLTRTNVGNAQAGSYRAIVSSGGVSLTSEPAVLTLGDGPAIVTQPAGQTVSVGDNVTISVDATGASPIFYQWTLNGNPIPGATTSSYNITGAQPLNSGSYQVHVANALGYAQSDRASLIVLVGDATPNSVDYFTNRININPLLGPVFGNNQSATKETGETNHVGKVGGKSIWYSWTASFTGVISLTTRGSSFDTLLGVYTGTNVTNLVQVAADDDSGGYFSSQVTFNAVEGTEYVIAIDGFKGASGNVVLGLTAGEGYRVLDSDGGEQAPHITSPPQDQTVTLGGTATLSVVAEGPDPLTYQWYLNGSPVFGATSSTLRITNFQEDSVGSYYVLVANDAGADQSAPVNVDLLAGASAGVSTSTSQDKIGNVTIIDGGAGTQAVDSSHEEAGGTSRGYTTTQIFSTSGSTKEASEPNHCGVVGGASVWYGYKAPANGTLSIDTVGSDYDTILAVYTTPSGFLDFASLQSKGCTNASGMNGGETVRFTAVSNTIYYIVVDGVNGASGTVHLNINLGNAPTITAAPQSVTKPAAGQNVTFNVSATGTTNLYYQWQFNSSDLPSATKASLTITNAQAIDTGLYTVIVSNIVSAVTSSPAFFAIAVSPAIVVQPVASTNFTFGTKPSLSVTAAGTSLHYQWQFNNVDIKNGTLSTLTLNGVVFTNAGNYRVIVTNASGSITSSVAAVGVLPPTPKIILPAANFKYLAGGVGQSAAFSGTLVTGVGITNVQCQVNGGAFQDAVIAAGNWSASVVLNLAATNVFVIKARNMYGESTTTNRSVYVVQKVPLTVIINTPGTGSPAPATTMVNNTNLEISKIYTIMASPIVNSGAPYIFTNWTGDVSGTTNKITFQMRSNLVIQANFNANPFVNYKGIYNGLFYETNSNGITHPSSGFFTFNLGANQSASGSIYSEGVKYSLAAKFDITGNSHALVPRAGKTPLAVDLHVDDSTKQVTGTVAPTNAAWSAMALGDKAIFNLTDTKATNFTGNYTMVLPGSSDPTVSPAGDSYLYFSILTNGTVAPSGKLADGEVLKVISTSISKNGEWPFYSPLYNGKGSIIGWLTATNNPGRAVVGTVNWTRTSAAVNSYYTSGFTNELNVVSDRYVTPANGVRAVNFSSGKAIYFGGNLSTPVTNTITLSANNVFTVTSGTNRLKITSPTSTGFFSGSFVHPDTHLTNTFSGVLLQGTNNIGAGYFLGPNQSGLILLQGN